MKIVFYTSRSSLSSEKFKYMYAHIAYHFDNVAIVAVDRDRADQPFNIKIRRFMRKIRRLGLYSSCEIISSRPLLRYFSNRDHLEIHNLLRQLDRPDVKFDPLNVISVPTVNGPESVRVIERLQPSVIIQVDAGILHPQIFNLASIGTINLHHGIAPLIKGMASIHWGLWEKKPQWIGSTVHWIDEGIDTGDVLAYCFVGEYCNSERFPSLYVRATEGGVANIVETLQRLSRGERWSVTPPDGPHVERSTFSGWRLLILHLTDKSRNKSCFNAN
jgi:hypothetical protein